ncbi:hypothetical protein [Marivivens sp.]|nr:hypothetical protein [Marivivens sp.]
MSIKQLVKEKGWTWEELKMEGLRWYDNEWGFSNRMADTAVAMGKLI